MDAFGDSKDKKYVRNAIKQMDVSDYADERQVKLDMSLNENCIGPSEAVVESIHSIEREKISGYCHPGKLHQKLGDFLDIGSEKIVFCDGCDGGIEMIAQTFFEPGTTVAVPVPSFPRYETHILKMGAEIEFLDSDTEIHPSIEEMQNADADYLLLANPQNPTGEKFSHSDIKRLKQNFNGILIVDEAMSHCPDSHAHLADKNLVLVGSFSKFFGMAGLRAGYIVSDYTEDIEKTGSPFKLNSIAQEAISKVIEDEDYMEKTADAISNELDYLKSQLGNLGISYTDSCCMTLLMDFSDAPLTGSEVYEILMKQGIKTVEGKKFRGLSHNFLRLSVRSREENRKFIEALEKVVQGYE